jgi:hypothetical protein
MSLEMVTVELLLLLLLLLSQLDWETKKDREKD